MVQLTFNDAFLRLLAEGIEGQLLVATSLAAVHGPHLKELLVALLDVLLLSLLLGQVFLLLFLFGAHLPLRLWKRVGAYISVCTYIRAISPNDATYICDDIDIHIDILLRVPASH